MKCELDLSIFGRGRIRVGPKKSLLFQVEKILPMTILLDAAGLNFEPGSGGSPTYFVV